MIEVLHRIVLAAADHRRARAVGPDAKGDAVGVAVDQESGPIDLSPQSRQEVRGIRLCLSHRAKVP